MRIKIPYGYSMEPNSNWSFFNLIYWYRCLKRSYYRWMERWYRKKYFKEEEIGKKTRWFFKNCEYHTKYHESFK